MRSLRKNSIGTILLVGAILIVAVIQFFGRVPNANLSGAEEDWQASTGAGTRGAKQHAAQLAGEPSETPLTDYSLPASRRPPSPAASTHEAQQAPLSQAAGATIPTALMASIEKVPQGRRAWHPALLVRATCQSMPRALCANNVGAWTSACPLLHEGACALGLAPHVLPPLPVACPSPPCRVPPCEQAHALADIQVRCAPGPGRTHTQARCMHRALHTPRLCVPVRQCRHLRPMLSASRTRVFVRVVFKAPALWH